MRRTDAPGHEMAAACPGAESSLTHSRFLDLFGWGLILGGLGLFFIWASLAPLDQGVSIRGSVTVDGNLKAVQHQAGGTIAAIQVREGDEVTAGQVLVEINSVQIRATAEIAKIQLLAAIAKLQRLNSELGMVMPSKGANLFERDGLALREQGELLVARREALSSEMAAMDESVAGILSANRALLTSRESRIEQAALLQQQIEGMRDLARDGFLSRNSLIDKERELAQLRASVAEEAGNIERNVRQVNELRLRRTQRHQEFFTNARAERADLAQEVKALQARFDGLMHEAENSLVRSPVSGIVANVNISTVGGVVAPGFRMMDILPLSEPLIVEGEVPVDSIDSVRMQLPVELSLSAFNQDTTPRVPAVVTHVAADSVVNEKTGQTFYRMRAAFTPEGQTLIRRFGVRPGMPVELFVRTGERTFFSYLLRPLQDKFHSSLREE